MEKGYLQLNEVDGWVYTLDDAGKERVVGVSKFPWNSGTSEILDTLHVTKNMKGRSDPRG